MSSSKCDINYLRESTKGDLNVKMEHPELLSPSLCRYSPRGIFCSRTLNLRSISTIGYDMDYTLMHYNVMAWEGRAYDYCMENLKSTGFPVDGLSSDPDLVIRGLVIDKERGNLVKADRFGYVKRAMHGTQMLSTQAVSEIYGREPVDLRKEDRWKFLNTLFSVSEAVAYMQMVDRLDDGSVAAEVGPLDYKGLFKAVKKALVRAHAEGQLKSEIMSKPELFVEPDPELPLALLDQKEAGKKLLLITNSDFHYTDKMMKHSFNRFLPNDKDWRDLFDVVSGSISMTYYLLWLHYIIKSSQEISYGQEFILNAHNGRRKLFSARKPEFFRTSHPMYEVVTSEGLMRPSFMARTGGLYSGGSAQMVEILSIYTAMEYYMWVTICTQMSVSPKFIYDGERH
ncbi:uncharacterized protein LOC115690591 [Syzygium oleosum]|uniref:uncharacterized protein LOC115690591 n=1 Tax=Syzygium oleosum TaxID=219896 RepID=UPI0024BB00A2|nr:uncharacterized protein LOC115690591 [Syzygium oleosum]